MTSREPQGKTREKVEASTWSKLCTNTHTHTRAEVRCLLLRMERKRSRPIPFKAPPTRAALSYAPLAFQTVNWLFISATTVFVLAFDYCAVCLLCMPLTWLCMDDHNFMGLRRSRWSTGSFLISAWGSQKGSFGVKQKKKSTTSVNLWICKAYFAFFRMLVEFCLFQSVFLKC